MEQVIGLIVGHFPLAVEFDGTRRLRCQRRGLLASVQNHAAGCHAFRRRNHGH